MSTLQTQPEIQTTSTDTNAQQSSEQVTLGIHPPATPDPEISGAFANGQAAIEILHEKEITATAQAASAKSDLEQLARIAAAAAADATANETASPSATSKTYEASLSHQGLPGLPRTKLPPEFAEAVLSLEASLGMPVWLLVQDGKKHELCTHIEELFFQAKNDLKAGQPIALLIESPGGSATCAYRIAKLLQRRCSSFTAIVANSAKSAATLLALGSAEIILSDEAQLGPLDLQIFDTERENFDSALNETQAFEHLHAVGLEALDRAVLMLTYRTGKRVETILPHALRFISDTMRPLLEKVDVVQYTNRLRTLKEAEEYATRLMRPNYSLDEAAQIAGHLVEDYPTHEFVIDLDEAKRIGLRVKEPTGDQQVYLDKIVHYIKSMNAFGRVIVTS